MISTDQRYSKKHATVRGKSMAYVDVGDGQPIVLVHGNPTSSYLWRNVMVHLEGLGRLIAPDMIGMGDSDKLDDSGPGSYRFVEHRAYLDDLLEQLGVTSDVTFVVHDWGSAYGFDWANRHRAAVKGIAYMEAIVQPMSWDQWPATIRPVFEGFRSAGGEEMGLQKNFFVERILPGAVLRGLTETEMEVYRRPYLEAGESRRPTLTWPREIPLAGEPADVVEIVDQYGKWLAESTLPKLFVNADPGAILTGANREFCRTWPNQREVTVKGSHFIPEDSPDEIGRAIADWYKTLG
jgi:haloalkane dehalogenase